MQLQVWFRVPCLQTCKWTPLGLSPALPLLTAGLEHPPRSRAWSIQEQSVRAAKLLRVHRRIFGCPRCQDDVPASHTRSHMARSCLFVFSQSFSHLLACHNNRHHPFESLGFYPYKFLYQRKLKLFFLCSFPWPCLK